MRLEALRRQVCDANRQLKACGLVILTWGNVSAYSPEEGVMVIKPSGIAYEDLTSQNMVLVDRNGSVLEGDLQPSSDTMTHLELYKQYPSIGSIVHTHSPWATIWAQMGRGIPPLGTTHADDFYGEIPCTRALTEEEIERDYEKNTGKVILETLAQGDIQRQFGVLVREHGPFVWEKTPEKAVEKAMVLEQVAMMAWHCRVCDPACREMSPVLMQKHFERKHGPNAYYGQIRGDA